MLGSMFLRENLMESASDRAMEGVVRDTNVNDVTVNINVQDNNLQVQDSGNITIRDSANNNVVTLPGSGDGGDNGTGGGDGGDGGDNGTGGGDGGDNGTGGGDGGDNGTGGGDGGDNGTGGGDGGDNGTGGGDGGDNGTGGGDGGDNGTGGGDGGDNGTGGGDGGDGGDNGGTGCGNVNAMNLNWFTTVMLSGNLAISAQVDLDGFCVDDFRVIGEGCIDEGTESSDVFSSQMLF